MINLKKRVRVCCSKYFRCLPKPVRYHIQSMWRLFSNDYISSQYRKHISVQLCQRLRTDHKPSIWFLSWTTWFSNAFQRPQQMARALAEIGCTVIYYEPWEFEKDFTSTEGFCERKFIGVRDIAPRLHLLRCPRNLLPDYIVECQPDALLMMWPHQAKFIPSHTPVFVIYEMLDDHSLSSNVGEAWRNIHSEWVRKSDIVVATADVLMEQLYPERTDTLLLPNGVKIEDWIFFAPPPVPDDMVDARRHPVVVGYHGAISKWFNWEMWEYAARLRLDWAFVLVGLPYLVTYESVFTRISRHPNMYYLGPKSYKDLPNYTIHFDIATIPFVINKITNACSPVKLFEYMAVGKPVVASSMREILKYKSVLFADSPEAFVNQLDKALRIKDDSDYRLILKQEAEANTWRSRAELLRRTIESVRRQQNNIPRRIIFKENA